MQCLTRSPEHQSGCVPSDSPQMLYGSLWICFRSLAQKPAQPFLHHVVWIMQELDGESYDFWEKHFFRGPLINRTEAALRCQAFGGFSPRETVLGSGGFCGINRTDELCTKGIVSVPVHIQGWH